MLCPCKDGRLNHALIPHQKESSRFLLKAQTHKDRGERRGGSSDMIWGAKAETDGHPLIHQTGQPTLRRGGEAGPEPQ